MSPQKFTVRCCLEHHRSSKIESMESPVAHKLNLIVSCSIDELEDVKQIMDGVKKIVESQKHEGIGKIEDFTRKVNLPEHKLIQHVDTRWNSTFYARTVFCNTDHTMSPE